MTFYNFKDITKEHQFLGGKAFALGLMANANFPVPIGAVCSSYPKTEEEWREILAWWKSVGSPKLAIRSSAQGEDSGDQSFAGQNSTYLNVSAEESIKESVLKCFESINKNSSALYREHFLKEKSSSVKMNVVLQEMVNPKYSGVFFSIDPRQTNEGWVCEAIEGYGEDLVSGKKTPFHFSQSHKDPCHLFNLDEVVKVGLAVKEFFGFEIDMEWAIDQVGQFKVLQARPITALSGKSSKEKELFQSEIKRLKLTHSSETIWDGQTFAEWSGPPTELTFSLWKKAFGKGYAFSTALEKLGYLGINEELNNETHSLLERILGRGYINISLMAPLYFGSIPYKMVASPKPHLVFDYKKMTLKNFLETPLTIWKMIKIGWKLSTQRKENLNECAKELSLKNKKLVLQNYEDYSLNDCLESFKELTHQFVKNELVTPLVLINLIESTNQSLRSLLKGVLKPEDIEFKLKSWMSHGLHTQSMKMNEDYLEAAIDASKRDSFLNHYGHRGPGELELSHPRFRELGEKIFYKIKNNKINHPLATDVKEEILSLKTYKKLAILKEWELLKEMLELREAWKMSILHPYEEIRLMSLEIGKRLNCGELIFWHSFEEIVSKSIDLEKAKKRKEEVELLKSISLPPILSLNEIEEIFKNENNESEKNKNQKKLKNTIQGTPLSSGIVYGEVRVVTNPESIDTDLWPDNVILVAESTDPGWTGLFLKSVGVIVEKGGVLSHCAIVAREMNLPAVSEVKQCHLRYKDGDLLWINGNNGIITTNHSA